MGRLLALILGGLALALYVPPLFLEDSRPIGKSNAFDEVFVNTIGADWYGRIKHNGAGIFAGLALILFSVRGKD